MKPRGIFSNLILSMSEEPTNSALQASRLRNQLDQMMVAIEELLDELQQEQNLIRSQIDELVREIAEHESELVTNRELAAWANDLSHQLRQA